MRIASFTLIRDMEQTIGYMLRSLIWVDQIIICLDNSSDRTETIIKAFMIEKGYEHKISLFKNENKIPVFEAGEKEERNRLLDHVFQTYTFDYLLLVDGDELVSSTLKPHIEKLASGSFHGIAFSCYHLFDSFSYLHFYEATWNSIQMIDPHVRVLHSMQKYVVGAWEDTKHPWLQFNSQTLCLDIPCHFHLKYFSSFSFINTSLPFLPLKLDHENARDYLRPIPSIPNDIYHILFN